MVLREIYGLAHGGAGLAAAQSRGVVRPGTTLVRHETSGHDGLLEELMRAAVAACSYNNDKYGNVIVALLV